MSPVPGVGPMAAPSDLDFVLHGSPEHSGCQHHIILNIFIIDRCWIEIDRMAEAIFSWDVVTLFCFGNYFAGLCSPLRKERVLLPLRSYPAGNPEIDNS